MSAFATYSTTPALNVSIRGINAAEGCPAENVNDILRAICAEGKELHDLVLGQDFAGVMSLSGGEFTGDISREDAGGYLYHNSPSLTGGKIYVQTSATALPSSPAEGTIVMQY